MDAARVVPESIFGDPTRTNPTHQLNDPTRFNAAASYATRGSIQPIDDSGRRE